MNATREEMDTHECGERGTLVGHGVVKHYSDGYFAKWDRLYTRERRLYKHAMRLCGTESDCIAWRRAARALRDHEDR